MFQCSVDTEGVSISWTVNGYSSTSSFITNQSIVTEGAGTQKSKLTIPGDPTLNGTTVICIASGVVNGEHYINSSSAVLYIQGIVIVVAYDIIYINCKSSVLSTLLHVQSISTYFYYYLDHEKRF